MSINSVQHVSLYMAIDAAVSLTDLHNSNDVLEDFARWGWEAENKIGSTDTYRRYECELDVVDFRACVPDNFMYLNALSVGGTILDVTNRDFQMFNKAKSLPAQATPERYLSGQKILCNPGQAGSTAVVFQDTFLPGDVVIVNVTVIGGSSGNTTTNSFNYTVLGGDTTQDILTNLAAQINAILLPYYAVADLSNLRLAITGRNATVNFNVTHSTTSVTGEMSLLTLTLRVAPSEICEPCETTPALIPASGSDNLANRSAANLNTQQGSGKTSYSGNNSVYSIVNNNFHFNAIENGKVGISYMGMELDENGWPMIKSTHVRAVSFFIAYNYMYRQFCKGKVAEYVVTKLDRDWHYECGQARGDDEMPDSNELNYLANMWNQLLPLGNRNLF